MVVVIQIRSLPTIKSRRNVNEGRILRGVSDISSCKLLSSEDPGAICSQIYRLLDFPKQVFTGAMSKFLNIVKEIKCGAFASIISTV